MVQRNPSIWIVNRPADRDEITKLIVIANRNHPLMPATQFQTHHFTSSHLTPHICNITNSTTMSSDNWFTSSLNPNPSYSTPSRPGTYGNNLSQSSNSTTPQQPFSSYGHSQSQSQNGIGNTGGGGSRARFLGDEMDVEDVNMADNDATKFYTPWGSSPSAAKVGSPGGNSPGIRKSPSARFGITSPDA